jgi:hypothetical protein
MAIYLLDTGVIIDVLNQREIGRLLLGKLLSEGHLLACCLINVTETYAGKACGTIRSRSLLPA